jgi:hypothetical protein
VKLSFKPVESNQLFIGIPRATKYYFSKSKYVEEKEKHKIFKIVMEKKISYLSSLPQKAKIFHPIVTFEKKNCLYCTVYNQKSFN